MPYKSPEGSLFSWVQWGSLRFKKTGDFRKLFSSKHSRLISTSSAKKEPCFSQSTKELWISPDIYETYSSNIYILFPSPREQKENNRVESSLFLWNTFTMWEPPHTPSTPWTHPISGETMVLPPAVVLEAYCEIRCLTPPWTHWVKVSETRLSICW